MGDWWSVQLAVAVRPIAAAAAESGRSVQAVGHCLVQRTDPLPTPHPHVAAALSLLVHAATLLKHGQRLHGSSQGPSRCTEAELPADWDCCLSRDRCGFLHPIPQQRHHTPCTSLPTPSSHLVFLSFFYIYTCPCSPLVLAVHHGNAQHCQRRQRARRLHSAQQPPCVSSRHSSRCTLPEHPDPQRQQLHLWRPTRNLQLGCVVERPVSLALAGLPTLIFRSRHPAISLSLVGSTDGKSVHSIHSALSASRSGGHRRNRSDTSGISIVSHSSDVVAPAEVRCTGACTSILHPCSKLTSLSSFPSLSLSLFLSPPAGSIHRRSTQQPQVHEVRTRLYRSRDCRMWPHLLPLLRSQCAARRRVSHAQYSTLQTSHSQPQC